MISRRLRVAVFASLLGLALIASAAQGATQVRQVHVEVPSPPTMPGTLTLDFIFKNKRSC
jgi:hypothetical protein